MKAARRYDEVYMTASVEHPEPIPPAEPVSAAPPGEKISETEKSPPPLFAIVAFVVTVLLFATAFLSGFGFKVPDQISFVGRFHPVLLHLPIGLLVGLLFVEITNGLLSSADLRPAAWTLLWLTSVSAVLTALLGAFLAMGGGYNEDTLFWHRWLGTSVAIVTVWMLAFRLHARSRKAKKTPFIYYALLVVSVGLIGPAGHNGGSLTHGKGYLLRYMPDSIRGMIGLAPAAVDEPIEIDEFEFVEEEPPGLEEAAPPADESSVEPVPPGAVIPGSHVSAFLPILQHYCGACHGAAKQKGNLRLDSLEAALLGSHDGPVIKPGSAEQSPLIQRMILPLEHEDHMPPDGKPQPGEDDIAVLRSWIDSWESGEAAPDETKILEDEEAAGQ